MKELGYSIEDLSVELFASDKQHVLDLYCSKGKNCSYKFHWLSLGMAYGTPRVSELGKVLTKVTLEQSCMVRKVYSDFNTACLLSLSCCLLLV